MKWLMLLMTLAIGALLQYAWSEHRQVLAEYAELGQAHEACEAKLAEASSLAALLQKRCDDLELLAPESGDAWEVIEQHRKLLEAVVLAHDALSRYRDAVDRATRNPIYKDGFVEEERKAFEASIESLTGKKMWLELWRRLRIKGLHASPVDRKYVEVMATPLGELGGKD